MSEHLFDGVNPVLNEPETIPAVPLDSEDKRMTRWVFFAGDLISPDTKRSARRLAWGGDTTESDYRTLFRTRNILYRNRLTPMLPGLQWVNVDLCPDDAPGVLSVKNFGTANAPNLQNAFAAYPGSEITSLLQRKRAQGLIELSALKGWSPERVAEARIQQHFFPEWDEYAAGRKRMPSKLSWTRETIQAGINATNDPALRSIGADMLKAVDAFYFWGLDRLKQETTMVKAPPVPGTSFTFSYTSLAEQLFEMLEKSREDYLRADTADLLSNFTANAQNSNVSVEMVNTMTEMLKQNQALISALLANASGNAGAVTVSPTPPAVTETASQESKEPSEEEKRRRQEWGQRMAEIRAAKKNGNA